MFSTKDAIENDPIACSRENANVNKRCVLKLSDKAICADELTHPRHTHSREKNEDTYHDRLIDGSADEMIPRWRTQR